MPRMTLVTRSDEVLVPRGTSHRSIVPVVRKPGA